MIDPNRLKLIDTLVYALDDIKRNTTEEEYNALVKWIGNKPYYVNANGQKCILASDLQLYLRLRANALKSHGR